MTLVRAANEQRRLLGVAVTLLYSHSAADIVQYRLKVASIDVSLAVVAIVLHDLRAITRREPVARVFVRRDNSPFSERFGIDAFDKTLFPQLPEVVLERTVTKVSPLISQVPIESFPRQCHMRVYKKRKHAPLPVLLRHVPTISTIREIRIGLVRIVLYWPTLTNIDHTCSIPAKQLSVPAVQRVKCALYGSPSSQPPDASRASLRRSQDHTHRATPWRDRLRFDSGRGRDSGTSVSALPEKTRRACPQHARRCSGVWWSDMHHKGSPRYEIRGPFSDVQAQQHEASVATGSRHCLGADGDGDDTTDPHVIDTPGSSVVIGP